MQKMISPNTGGGASSLNEASPPFSRRSFVKMAAVSAGFRLNPLLQAVNNLPLY